MPRESQTESNTTILATMSSEPRATSTESPSTDSETATEADLWSSNTSETTDTAVEHSSTETAKTYPKRSHNQVERYEPTW